MNEFSFSALGIGGNSVESIVPSEGVYIEDGKLCVDTDVLTVEKPNAWFKASKNDIKESDVDDWHWGLYSDSTSTTDIWGGAFHGKPFETGCGNALGLDTTDLVEGRVIKVWCEKDGSVLKQNSLEIHLI